MGIWSCYPLAMHEYIEAYTDEWHEARTKYITGTAAAAIMGLSRYSNWESTLREYKTGREFKQTRNMWWGSHSEESNILAFGQALCPAAKIETMNRFYISYPFGATIDGTIEFSEDATLIANPLQAGAHSYWQRNLVNPLTMELRKGNTKGLVEAKQTGIRNLKDWGVEPPIYYWAQCQIQMHVTGLPWCILFARVGVADLRAHLIMPDAEFIEVATDMATKFLEELHGNRDNIQTED